MSELTKYSISVLIGDAHKKIWNYLSKVDEKVGDLATQHSYETTPIRESRLQDLYTKNIVKLEEEYGIDRPLVMDEKEMKSDGKNQITAKSIHAISIYESVAQVKPMAMIAENRHHNKMKKIRTAISAIRSCLKTPDIDPDSLSRLADYSEQLIRKITNDTHSLLAKAEEQLAMNIVTESMGALGYDVKTQGTSLLATNKSNIIKTRIQPGGIKLDTRSFNGISCHTELRRIEKDLENRGLILHRLQENPMNLIQNRLKLKDPFPVFTKKISEKENEPSSIQGIYHKPSIDMLIQNYLHPTQTIKIKRA